MGPPTSPELGRGWIGAFRVSPRRLGISPGKPRIPFHEGNGDSTNLRRLDDRFYPLPRCPRESPFRELNCDWRDWSRRFNLISASGGP